MQGAKMPGPSAPDDTRRARIGTCPPSVQKEASLLCSGPSESDQENRPPDHGLPTVISLQTNYIQASAALLFPCGWENEPLWQ